MLNALRTGACPKLTSFVLSGSATPLKDAEQTKPPGMASTSMPKVSRRAQLVGKVGGHDRAQLHHRVGALALDAAGAHHDAGLVEGEVRRVEEGDQPDLPVERIDAERLDRRAVLSAGIVSFSSTLFEPLTSSSISANCSESSPGLDDSGVMASPFRSISGCSVILEARGHAGAGTESGSAESGSDPGCFLGIRPVKNRAITPITASTESAARRPSICDFSFWSMISFWTSAGTPASVRLRLDAARPR